MVFLVLRLESGLVNVMLTRKTLDKLGLLVSHIKDLSTPNSREDSEERDKNTVTLLSSLLC